MKKYKLGEIFLEILYSKNINLFANNQEFFVIKDNPYGLMFFRIMLGVN